MKMYETPKMEMKAFGREKVLAVSLAETPNSLKKDGVDLGAVKLFK